MRRRTSTAAPLCLALALLLPLALEARQQPEGPTVDELVAKHVEARGGLDKLKAVQALRMTGTLTAQGLEIPVTLLRARPNRLRVEMEVQGMEVVQAFDGETAWGSNPMMGTGKPEKVEGPEAQQLADQADFDGLLVDARRRGTKLELAGKETIDGRDYYRLEATLKSGSKRTVFLDAEDYLDKRVRAEVNAQGSIVEANIVFSDYREVAGVLVPFSQLTSTPMGEFTFAFETIEVPADLDTDVFFMPGQEADPSLTLTQVLEQHRAARVAAGGAEVETVKATGKVVFQGFELPMTMTFARPQSFRLDIDLQGLPMVLAGDGEVTWAVSPMQGISEPEALPEEARGVVAVFSDFMWGMLTDPAVEAKAELDGVAEVERDQTYHLAVETAGGRRDVYLGGESFLERQLSFTGSFMGSSGQIDARLADWQTRDGLVMPRYIQLLVNGSPVGEMRIAGLEVNVAVDATIFAMPPKPAEPPTQ